SASTRSTAPPPAATRWWRCTEPNRLHRRLPMKPNPNRHLRLLPLALVLAMALPAHAAGADSRDRDPEQVRAELEQARAELQAAARRVAELSRELGTRQALVSIGDTRPRLGILLGEDEEGGVRIAGVTPGSGADQAG